MTGLVILGYTAFVLLIIATLMVIIDLAVNWIGRNKK